MCHGYHYDSVPAEDHEDRHIRASDAERESVVETLRTHAEAGRLNAEELEERVDGALHATTRADLDALQRDLPQPRPRTPHVRTHRGGPPPFVGIALLLIAIWALTGGYFWPIWPLLWFAFIGMRRA